MASACSPRSIAVLFVEPVGDGRLESRRVAAREPEVGMCVEVLGDGIHALLTLGECPLHQRLDDLTPFVGRHHLVEFEKHLGRDGE